MEFAVEGEFNFVSYTSGSKKSALSTLYVFAGVALYHFNPKKIKKLQEEGKTFIETIANPITDEIEVSRTAYKIYNIMKELVEHFYDENNRIGFIKKGLEDYEKRKEEMTKRANNQQFEGLPKLPKEFIEGYMEKKKEFIKKEMEKNK